MRAKTLLLSAVLGAAFIVTTSAQQTVYSVNAVGYVNVNVPANQFVLLANPLNLPTNSLTAVLPDVPNNTQVYEFNPATAGFAIYTKRSATLWTGTGADTARLDPGEGFFVKNVSPTTDFKITFVGEVMQGTNVTAFPAGFSLLASKVPQAGLVETDLLLPAANGDILYKLGAAGYTIYTKRTGTTWTPSQPSIGVAEGFFFNAKAAGSWNRTFNVNQ